jgi:predicted RNA-binding Zn-ribbon protein involved in translation (DUF1610 family)
MTRMNSEQITDYESRWQFLRRQYRLLWALMLTFFPAVFIIGFGGSARWHSIIPLFAVWLCWAVPLTVIGRRFTVFPCPQCGRAFFRRGGMSRLSAFEPRCVHCGLPMWAPGPPEGHAR